MVEHNFIGTWKLLSFEFRRSDGGVIYPLGKNPVGMLMYDGRAHMSVHLMNPDRKNFAISDQLKSTTEEMKQAFEGFIAYFGTYEIDKANSTVVHHVQGSLFPNLVGKDQKRFFKFNGDKLELTAPARPWGGISMTGVLLWERIA